MAELAGRSVTASKLREQGNVIYKQLAVSVEEGGLNVSIRRIRLSRANQLYTEALRSSSTPDDKASCYKNLGMLNWLWCKSELKELKLCTKDTLTCACKKQLHDAVSYLLQARRMGAAALKSDPWMKQIENTLSAMVYWTVAMSSRLSVPESPLVKFLCEAIENSECSNLANVECAMAFKNYANILFNEAIVLCEGDGYAPADYKACYRLLNHCSQPLVKANDKLNRERGHVSMQKDEVKTLMKELKELEESVYLHICTCEAMQAIELGDEALKEAVEGSEELKMEMVKDALDHYRRASSATKERDMETEAMAMSKIGRVYTEVLKMNDIGCKHHYQAVRLALTVMSPRIARSPWYIFSEEKVKLHQQRVEAEEEEDKDREAVLAKLKPKLQCLAMEARKGPESFLKYVYSKHPLPDPKKNIVSRVGSKDELKVSLKKAILHYHPDKNATCNSGQQWKVLCEDIC